MYEQLKTPNLDPVLYQGKTIILNWVGWCLLYVQTAFGVSWAGSTAKDAWENRVSIKHLDRNIPSGLYVPIWFSGYYNQGHVAIYKDGKVWSTPVNKGSTFIVFNSIDALINDLKAYDIKYIGWSEDIGGEKVIEKGEDMIQDTDHEYARWSRLGYQIRGRGLTRDEFKLHAVGKSWLNAIEILSDDPEANATTRAQEIGQMAVRDNWEGQIYSLIDQLKALPQDTGDAEKKLQSIKDALGIK